MRDLLHPLGIADMVVIVSLLAPIVGEGLAFLRVARMLRLLRSYQTVRRLRTDFDFFRRHQQTIDAGINLFVFLFVMTAIVYETQHAANPKIEHYADALYFTVTTLTTTGFGRHHAGGHLRQDDRGSDHDLRCVRCSCGWCR